MLRPIHLKFLRQKSQRWGICMTEGELFNDWNLVTSPRKRQIPTCCSFVRLLWDVIYSDILVLVARTSLERLQSNRRPLCHAPAKRDWQVWPSVVPSLRLQQQESTFILLWTLVAFRKLERFHKFRKLTDAQKVIWYFLCSWRNASRIIILSEGELSYVYEILKFVIILRHFISVIIHKHYL
jgi:hypothetical protein